MVSAGSICDFQLKGALIVRLFGAAEGAVSLLPRYRARRIDAGVPGVLLEPFSLPARREVHEPFAGLHERRRNSGRRFKATNNDVSIERIEFDAATDSAGLMGGHECRSGTQEGIDDDVAPVAKVQKGVFEHRGRLDRRVVLKAAAGVGAKRRSARIRPDVRAPAPPLAELDIVDVRGGAVPEQGQQLVLGAVEAAHSGVGLRPHDKIERIKAKLDRRGVDGRVSTKVPKTAPSQMLGSAAAIQASLKARNSALDISPEAMPNSRWEPPVTCPEIGTL